MTKRLRRLHAPAAAGLPIEDLRAVLGSFFATAMTTRMAMIFTEADAAGHPLLFANDSFLALTGFTRDAVLGRELAVLLEKMTGGDMMSSITRALDAGADGHWQLPCRRVDGSEFLAAIYLSPVRDERGAARQYFLSIVALGGSIDESPVDVTERDRARDEVLALQADLIHLAEVSTMETLATTLSHELNQPLAAIVNYTAGAKRLLAADAVSPHQLVELLQLIGDSAEHAGEIIRHLRSLTNRETPFRSLFDLHEAIGRCIRLVKLGECANVDIVVAGAPDIQLEGDPIQIQQVIINLLRNACHASIEAGNHSVEIATSLSDDTVTVAITDSGAGVPANLVRAGFRWTPSDKSDGMGVGLSISRAIVEAHDGKLWLRSSGAKGATFAFSLPRVAKPR